MTVQELIEKLQGAQPTDTVTIRVDCPYGGDSLPIEIGRVYVNPGEGVWFAMNPVDGWEFEVTGSPDEDEEEDDNPHPQFGQCGKCGDWCTFPCLNCQANELERGK